MKDALFHLAFPTHDVAAAKRFYVEGLGCTLGRESSHAVTFGLTGYQLVAHLTTKPLPPQQGIYPRPFGLVFLSKESWQQFLEQAQAKAVPLSRPVSVPGTRTTPHVFLEDPPNLLEF
jgi:extradiol dioxygenase family protein